MFGGERYSPAQPQTPPWREQHPRRGPPHRHDGDNVPSQHFIHLGGTMVGMSGKSAGLGSTGRLGGMARFGGFVAGRALPEARADPLTSLIGIMIVCSRPASSRYAIHAATGASVPTQIAITHQYWRNCDTDGSRGMTHENAIGTTTPGAAIGHERPFSCRRPASW